MGLGVDGPRATTVATCSPRRARRFAAGAPRRISRSRNRKAHDRSHCTEIATLGGAAVLGRDDIGSLEQGKQADLLYARLNRIEYAGALHDPVAAAPWRHQPWHVMSSCAGEE